MQKFDGIPGSHEAAVLVFPSGCAPRIRGTSAESRRNKTETRVSASKTGMAVANIRTSDANASEGRARSMMRTSMTTFMRRCVE